MKQLMILVLAGALAGTIVSTGCAGPYSAKPESLKKPRAKKRPKDQKPATEVPDDTDGTVTMSDEKCRTNFFAEPFKGRRKSRDARAMAGEAESTLVSAERSPARRKAMVIEAMSILENALEKDPYGPEPTYKLAVAYAMVGQKSCALALLERLKDLQKLPEVEGEAARTIQRASRDPAFDPFQSDAKRALGN
jgi:hypothetical protein